MVFALKPFFLKKFLKHQARNRTFGRENCSQQKRFFLKNVFARQWTNFSAMQRVEGAPRGHHGVERRTLFALIEVEHHVPRGIPPSGEARPYISPSVRCFTRLSRNLSVRGHAPTRY